METAVLRSRSLGSPVPSYAHDITIRPRSPSHHARRDVIARLIQIYPLPASVSLEDHGRLITKYDVACSVQVHRIILLQVSLEYYMRHPRHRAIWRCPPFRDTCTPVEYVRN